MRKEADLDDSALAAPWIHGNKLPLAAVLRGVPAPVISVAALTFLIAAYDVAFTLQLAFAGQPGRIGGTLLRDGLLVAGAVMLVRRARWAPWLLAPLFVLSLVRVMGASTVPTLIVNALALPALVILFLPSVRVWTRPAPEASEPAASA